MQRNARWILKARRKRHAAVMTANTLREPHAGNKDQEKLK